MVPKTRSTAVALALLLLASLALTSLSQVHAKQLSYKQRQVESGYKSGGEGENEGGSGDEGGSTPISSSNGTCTVTINGVEETFSGCSDLTGGMTVYYTYVQASDSLDIAFKAKPRSGLGWVAFGPAGSPGRMVGGNSVIAWPSTASSTGADAKDFELGGTSASAVNVANNQNLADLVAYYDSASGDLISRFTRPNSGIDPTSFPALWAWGPGTAVSARSTLREHVEYHSGTIDMKGTGVGSGANNTDNGDGTSNGEIIPAANCSLTINGATESFAGCRALSGGFTVYYTHNSQADTLDIAFQAKSEGGLGWVAFGPAGSPGKMVGGKAVIAYPSTGSATGATAADYSLNGESSSTVVVANEQQLSNLLTYYDSTTKIVTTRFTRPNNGLNPAKFPGLWALGPASSVARAGIREHVSFYSGTINMTNTGSDSQTVGSSSMDINSTIIAHAVLMSVAWILLVPVAIMIARYLKCKNPLWFKLHVAIQTSVLLIVIAAWILGLLEGEDGRSDEKQAHLVIGCIVCSLVIIQFLSGVFRPDKDAGKVRFWWEIYHVWMGRIQWILAMANVFIGMELVDAAQGWWIAVGVVFGFMFVTHIALEIFFFMTGRETHPKPAAKPVDEENVKAPVDNNSPQSDEAHQS